MDRHKTKANVPFTERDRSIGKVGSEVAISPRKLSTHSAWREMGHKSVDLSLQGYISFIPGTSTSFMSSE